MHFALHLCACCQSAEPRLHLIHDMVDVWRVHVVVVLSNLSEGTYGHRSGGGGDDMLRLSVKVV